LRGRAVQNQMFEGVARRRALINEMTLADPAAALSPAEAAQVQKERQTEKEESMKTPLAPLQEEKKVGILVLAFLHLFFCCFLFPGRVDKLNSVWTNGTNCWRYSRLPCKAPRPHEGPRTIASPRKNCRGNKKAKRKSGRRFERNGFLFDKHSFFFSERRKAELAAQKVSDQRYTMMMEVNMESAETLIQSIMEEALDESTTTQSSPPNRFFFFPLHCLVT